MALIDYTLLGIVDKVKVAIEHIRKYVPPSGYHVSFSGGKDSIVILDLVKKSGVKYTVNYSVTGADPPELLDYIKQYHPDVKYIYPERDMFELIKYRQMLPTRLIRFCSKELKQSKNNNAECIVTGIRRAESVRRRKRQLYESHNFIESGTMLHPIIDWSTPEVWEYIHTRKLPYCSLYDEGRKRIGCIMCPMQGLKKMQLDAQRWPEIAEKYRRAINEVWKEKSQRGADWDWESGDNIYYWWLTGHNGRLESIIPKLPYKEGEL